MPANLQFIKADKYKVGWETSLQDPYSVTSYVSDKYWNYIGRANNNEYETWIKIGFTDTEMSQPEKVASITFQLQFEYHSGANYSAKDNVGIICYIYSVSSYETDKYYLKSASTMDKDKKYLGRHKFLVNIPSGSSWNKHSFQMTLNSPPKECYIVLKPENETYCPTVHFGKDSVGGNINSTSRAWKTTATPVPASYKITLNPNNGAFSDGSTSSKTVETNSSGYVTLPSVSRSYYTFLGWGSNNLQGYQQFTNDTSLSAQWSKNTGKLKITNLTSSNCSKVEVSDTSATVVIGSDGTSITYNTGNNLKITVKPTFKDGYYSSSVDKEFSLNNSNTQTGQFPSVSNQYTIYLKTENGEIVKSYTGVKGSDMINFGKITRNVLIRHQTSEGLFLLNENLTFEYTPEINWADINVSPTYITINNNKFPAKNLASQKFDNGVWESIPQGTAIKDSFGRTITISNSGAASVAGQSYSYTGEDSIVNIWPIRLTKSNITLVSTDFRLTAEKSSAYDYITITTTKDLTNIKYKYWTQEENSPFAQFELKFEKQSNNTYKANFYLNQNLTLYPVKNNKTFLYNLNGEYYEYNINYQKWELRQGDI